MRIGIYLDLRNPPQWRRPWPDLYRQSLDLAVQAEEWGADSVWLSEHHFFEDGYLPQPAHVRGRGGRPHPADKDRHRGCAGPAALGPSDCRGGRGGGSSQQRTARSGPRGRLRTRRVRCLRRRPVREVPPPPTSECATCGSCWTAW